MNRLICNRLNDGEKVAGTVLQFSHEYVLAALQGSQIVDIGHRGPAGSVEEALKLVDNAGDRLDGAVLDINLRNERVYPVADVLTAHGIPFVFTTGYDSSVVPSAYAGAPRCEKPVDKVQLFRCLARRE